MVFVFWRRMQGTRGGWRLTATTPLNNIDHSLYFNFPNVNIVVPKLWDLSNGGIFALCDQSKGAEGLSDVTWANLMVHIVHFSSSEFHYETKKPSLAKITYPSLYLYIKK